MEITAAVAADLDSLSEALDEGDGDITDALRRLAADVSLAVRSYMGLTVMAGNGSFHLTFTAMEPFAYPSDVAGSLRMPLADGTAEDASVRLVVILYASRPGAFIDLAADLCWLTGRPLTDLAIDQHLNLPAEPDFHDGLRDWSLVNQAIGVLIGRGYTPEQAELELDTRATIGDHTRAEAAKIILAGVRPFP